MGSPKHTLNSRCEKRRPELWGCVAEEYHAESMGTLNIDRYHAAMGDASYKDVTRVHGKPLSEMIATILM